MADGGEKNGGGSKPGPPPTAPPTTPTPPPPPPTTENMGDAATVEGGTAAVSECEEPSVREARGLARVLERLGIRKRAVGVRMGALYPQRAQVDFRLKQGRRCLEGAFNSVLQPSIIKWKIIGQIGEGASADLYEAYHHAPEAGQGKVRTTRTFALKIAKRGNHDVYARALLNELKVLTALSSSQGWNQTSQYFPHLFDAGFIDDTAGYQMWYDDKMKLYVRAVEKGKPAKKPPTVGGSLPRSPYAVYEILRLSLDDLVSMAPLRRMGRRLSVNIALACLDALTALHDAGFVHNHLTPRNFMLRLPPGSRLSHQVNSFENDDKEAEPVPLQVVLVDLGTATPMSMPMGSLAGVMPGMVGTAKYAAPGLEMSVGWMGGTTVCGREDLWSLELMLVEWLRSPRPLPWATTSEMGGARTDARLAAVYREPDLPTMRLVEAHRILRTCAAPHAPLKAVYEAMLKDYANYDDPQWLPFTIPSD